ncbi:MAG: hypothetical protein PHP83_03810 [Clostridia bacterium]|nr:hypothetical protein [Clostridia bacterium]
MLRNFYEMVQNRREIKKYLKYFSQSMFQKLKQRAYKKVKVKSETVKQKATPILKSNENAL